MRRAANRNDLDAETTESWMNEAPTSERLEARRAGGAFLREAFVPRRTYVDKCSLTPPADGSPN